MKILHICLACYYLEGMGYQENILPYYHAKLGYKVEVITSEHVSPKDKSNGKNYYINDYGAKIKFVKNKYANRLSALRIYKGLYKEIEEIAPDIIFVHGGQFLSLCDVVRYVKNNKNVDLYIDQHADYYNSPITSFTSKIFSKCLIAYQMRSAAKYAKKFWGVTPWRCQYLNEVYGIPKQKIGLLIMGGDDEKIAFEETPETRNKTRQKLDLSEDDFVVITGGKIDKAKNIHLLLKAIKQIDNDKIKLIVFGRTEKDIEKEVLSLINDKHIKYIEWLPSEKVYDYFLSADLVIFPGTHSVLWEQACACGVPAVFKHWEGMHHVDVGGNCEFLYQDSVEEIQLVISDIYYNVEKYSKMKQSAQKCKKEFFYSEIAKKSIERG